MMALLWNLALALMQPVERVPLRLQLEPGREYFYRLHASQQSLVETPPASARDVQVSAEAEISCRVLPAEGRLRQVEIGLSHLKATQLVEGRKLPLKLLREGETIRLEAALDEQGTVCESRVLAQEQESEPARRLARSLARSLRQLWLPLPHEPVGVGESWPLRRGYPLLQWGEHALHMEIDGRVKFAGLERCRQLRCARLEAEFDCSSRGGLEDARLVLQPRLTGRGKTTLLLELENGVILSSRSEMILEGLLSAGQQGENLSSRVRLQMRAEMELVK